MGILGFETTDEYYIFNKVKERAEEIIEGVLKHYATNLFSEGSLEYHLGMLWGFWELELISNEEYNNFKIKLYEYYERDAEEEGEF